MLDWHTYQVVEMTSNPDASSMIVIKRRTVLQDLVRSYTVFVDDSAVGKLWAFQSGRYRITPGKHRVRLAILGTGTASSADVEVTVPRNGEVVLRTCGRGAANTLMLPSSLPAGAKAQITATPIRSRVYQGPWINLRVEP